MDRPLDNATFSREIWADLQVLYADDPGALGELILTYLGEAAQQVAVLHSALAAADPARLQRAAHTLRGCSASMGLAPLVELAARLEACGRAGDMAAAADLVHAAGAAYARVRQALAAPAPRG